MMTIEFLDEGELPPPRRRGRPADPTSRRQRDIAAVRQALLDAQAAGEWLSIHDLAAVCVRAGTVHATWDAHQAMAVIRRQAHRDDYIRRSGGGRYAVYRIAEDAADCRAYMATQLDTTRGHLASAQRSLAVAFQHDDGRVRHDLEDLEVALRRLTEDVDRVLTRAAP